MKKFLSMLLAASVASAMAVPAFAARGARFSDIDDEKYAWAKEYIEQMAAEGYIAGYEDNTYRPDNEVTRLETIVLFSRAMGALREENEEVLEKAHEMYDDVISAAKVNFGYDEIAFMLYRGVLTEADVRKFLAKGKGAEAMPRQEASAIITKAMCGEEDAKAEVLTDLEYTDARLIDPDYSQYVYYVSEKGIMNGMDDGSFSPDSSVLRSQIAVMLFRSVDKMNLYIETLPITDIDTAKNNVTILDKEVAEVAVGYTNDTKFFLDGEPAKEEDAVIGNDAMLTYINDKLVFIDMTSLEADETVKGIFQGSTTSSGKTTVTVKNTTNDETTEYELLPGAKLFREDESPIASPSQLSLGSYVELDLAGGKIIRLSQLKKNTTITDATVESVNIDKDLYITISHSDPAYDGMKLLLNDDVAVYKNNDREDLSKIYKGDSVNITFEYDIVSKIVASSNQKNYNGTIREIVISSNPRITVDINGEDKEFDIVPSIKITLDGEAATVYDLRVGDSVKVVVESGAVLSITTTASSVSGAPVSGTIETVNKSRGFIIVNGQTIFCSDSATTIVTSNGSTMKMSDLKEGTNVSVRGVTTNGAYTASLIIIE